MSEQKYFTLNDLKKFKTSFSDFKKVPKLCVIGNPVAHSLSPQMHQSALDSAGKDISYIRILAEPNELGEIFAQLKKNNFIGANITLPYKAQAMGLVDEVDSEAKRLGGVNCVLFSDNDDSNDRVSFGFNTDGTGFVRSVLEEFHVDVRDLRVVIFGAGGTGTALAFTCALQKCEKLVLVNRTKQKFEKIKSEILSCFADNKLVGPGSRVQVLGLDAKDELVHEVKNAHLLVNTTSVGMKLSDGELFPYSLISPFQIVYDVVYNPNPAFKTKLAKSARTQGARFCDGLPLLLWQGVYSYENWFGDLPDVGAMRKALHV